jgi:hypothetical protein
MDVMIVSSLIHGMGKSIQQFVNDEGMIGALPSLPILIRQTPRQIPTLIFLVNTLYMIFPLPVQSFISYLRPDLMASGSD